MVRRELKWHTRVKKLLTEMLSCWIIKALPPRSMVGHLPLEQVIGVRIPGGQPSPSSTYRVDPTRRSNGSAWLIDIPARKNPSATSSTQNIGMALSCYSHQYLVPLPLA